MIDMHCHLLYGVDDGPKTMEESVEMLKEASRQGVQAIILTPHWRHGMFPYHKDVIEAHYQQINEYAKTLGIALYLGTEYHVDSHMMENFVQGACHALADTRYILTEYSHITRFDYAKQMTAEAVRFGYVPVIAHAERYEFVMEDPECLEELRELGAMVQINADAVLGLDGRSAKKLCKWLLGNELTDMIASDSHGAKRRACNLQKCYGYVAKKYGGTAAKRLFCDNPAQILGRR